MGFVVLHMEKAHGSDSGTTAHIEHFIIPKNADPTRTHLNRKLIEYPEGVKDRSAAIQRRLEEAGPDTQNREQPSAGNPHQRVGNARGHGAYRTEGTDGRVVRRQPQIFRRHVREGEHRGGSPALGRENAAHARHACADSQGGTQAEEKEEQAKKRYRKKPADTVRLCADDIMSRLKLKAYQDSYAVAMEKYGLQRGVDGSEARHVSTQQYYRDIKRQTEELKTEVVELQERKETAREELERAKKEIQTERLKGAATTAAPTSPKVSVLFSGATRSRRWRGRTPSCIGR